jgi:hypothetical protein
MEHLARESGRAQAFPEDMLALSGYVANLI